MLADFFKIKHECRHNAVPADTDEAYCPDCGALVQNKWYVIRCSCCGIKRSAHTRRDEIIPDTKFCTNCGSADYYIKELDKLNFTDIRYAVFKKTAVKQTIKPAFSQVWTEEHSDNAAEELKRKAIPVFETAS